MATTPRDHPSVLFVCVHNAGKSQMAAALAEKYAGDRLEIHSAGTAAVDTVSAQAVEVIAEVGMDISGESPKPVDPQLLGDVDRVIILGVDAQLVMPGDARGTCQRWVTVEPAELGTDGMDGVERMRLIRDDIAHRVTDLLDDLLLKTT